MIYQITYLLLLSSTAEGIWLPGLFRKNGEYDGKTCPKMDQIIERPAYSEIQCASICRGSHVCDKIFYDQTNKVCYGCKRYKDRVNVTLIDAGVQTVGYMEVEPTSIYNGTSIGSPNIFPIQTTCNEILSKNPEAGSGVFTNQFGVQFYCDMETDGGGWIVFQKRFDYSVDFYQSWDKYKYGFGNMDGGEFWFGLEHLTKMLHAYKKSFKLRVDIDTNLGSGNAVYQTFNLSEESDKYRIRVGGIFTGILADSTFLGFAEDNQNNHMFSTWDSDNDVLDGLSCAQHFGGGFWYSDCGKVMLNSLGNMHWHPYNFRKCQMMVKEIEKKHIPIVSLF